MRALQLAVQRIGDELAHIVQPEGRQHNFPYARSRSANRLKRPHERVSSTGFVVPISADQQQMLCLRVRDQILKKLKACRVHALQIVEEQRERMLRPGKSAEEPAEHQLEAALRRWRGQVRNGGLFPDQKLHLRDEINDELAIRTQCFPNSVPPMTHHRVTLDQDLPDQRLKGLGQGRIRDVALVLVELTGCEEPARRNQHLVQLVQRAGNDLRRLWRLALVRQPGCNPEAGEPYVAVTVDERIRRLDVFMDEPLPVDLANYLRQANGNAEQSSQIERLSLARLQNQVQGLTAWVLQ